MRRQHPDHRMDIPISLKVDHQLLGASINTGFEKEDWEIAAEAIDEWVRRHDPNALAAPAHSGYQWKRLFLPDGTVLRTIFGAKSFHCVVEGGRIAFNGVDVSPSGFVNAAGGVRRNAWLCAWILFPDSKQWQLADALRAKRPRRPRPQKSATQLAAAPPASGGAPASIASGGSPLPTPTIPVVASSTDASYQPRTSEELAQQSPSQATASDRQPRVGNHVTPVRCVPGTGRRCSGDDAIAALLRQELLPLLFRICAGPTVPPASG